eukprot:3070229-Rhodomonas_salina.2
MPGCCACTLRMCHCPCGTPARSNGTPPCRRTAPLSPASPRTPPPPCAALRTELALQTAGDQSATNTLIPTSQ